MAEQELGWAGLGWAGLGWAGLGSGYREAGLREGSWVGGQTSSQFSYTVIYLITQRVLYFYFYFYNRCLHSGEVSSR